jgi:predicted nucleic acid-binding protein
VILVDANILIYAHVSSFAQHAAARRWLDQQLNGSGPVGLPWPSIVAFLRLVINPRIFEILNRLAMRGGKYMPGSPVKPYGYHSQRNGMPNC